MNETEMFLQTLITPKQFIEIMKMKRDGVLSSGGTRELIKLTREENRQDVLSLVEMV